MASSLKVNRRQAGAKKGNLPWFVIGWPEVKSRIEAMNYRSSVMVKVESNCYGRPLTWPCRPQYCTTDILVINASCLICLIFNKISFFYLSS